ncbi:hypothetical protein P8A22_04190 [Streptomyces laculatispora]|uniref:Uncharacterized protein n=1 Tax=Streptomyces laculatispora TaxID=887464 RepID=A0ABY9IF64_9ACTN|nr:hypothetical protein [Streptomyces laculatispora]WLQ45576.1 hypothetical protein P8A22_04190 [Streptomyces laculatispora]
MRGQDAPPERLRVDRELEGAPTHGPDPLHLAEVFGLDEKTAMRVADSARLLLETAVERKTVRTGSGLLPFCLPCPHEIEDCPGTVPGL